MDDFRRRLADLRERARRSALPAPATDGAGEQPARHWTDVVDERRRVVHGGEDE
jgi:hypothetical protein